MRSVETKALARAVELYGEWYVRQYLHETYEQFRSWLDGHENVPEAVFLRLVDLILSTESERLRASRPSPVDHELMSNRQQR
jgi:hypothetical protein